MNLKDVVSRNIAKIFLAALSIICIPLYATGKGNDSRPIHLNSDTITQQEKDSILFLLNLEYLNAVNDYETPFELIPIIEKILHLEKRSIARFQSG